MNELQIGTAGQHLVCADLILQGWNAFFAGEQLPYDVVAAKGEKIYRVQVKTTQRPREHTGLYAYSLRRARGSTRKIPISFVDFFAFVALDIKMIAYLHVKDFAADDKFVKQSIELRSTKHVRIGREYPGGRKRRVGWGKTFEALGEFRG